MKDTHDRSTQDFATLDPSFQRYMRRTQLKPSSRTVTRKEQEEIDRVMHYVREKPFLDAVMSTS